MYRYFLHFSLPDYVDPINIYVENCHTCKPVLQIELKGLLHDAKSVDNGLHASEGKVDDDVGSLLLVPLNLHHLVLRFESVVLLIVA